MSEPQIKINFKKEKIVDIQIFFNFRLLNIYGQRVCKPMNKKVLEEIRIHSNVFLNGF
jgi:hypothetical protein